jgi:hypothetical protein
MAASEHLSEISTGEPAIERRASEHEPTFTSERVLFLEVVSQ